MITNRGMRHLALKVGDVARAKEFYSRVFGMRTAWEPDLDNAYLSSGCDNLALHRDSATGGAAPALDHLGFDHLGFIVATIEEVERGYEWARQNGIEIAHPLRHHRDGSVSFYIRDPDGNLVQVLYEPSISPLRIAAGEG